MDFTHDRRRHGALQKLPHVLFFGGGVVIKIGDEVAGAIGASGARAPSWTITVHGPAWKKFEIG
jgi:uncharacterized protein GlcG (DUF336 family)